jgi:hypothetical protein
MPGTHRVFSIEVEVEVEVDVDDVGGGPKF